MLANQRLHMRGTAWIMSSKKTLPPSTLIYLLDLLPVWTGMESQRLPALTYKDNYFGDSLSSSLRTLNVDNAILGAEASLRGGKNDTCRKPPTVCFQACQDKRH